MMKGAIRNEEVIKDEIMINEMIRERKKQSEMKGE
jgi:hypothetical protein